MTPRHLIYLAARFDRQGELKDYRAKLEFWGHHVTSSWLEEDQGRLLSLARNDLADLFNSDMLMFFSEPPITESHRGGRHVEFGMALAWRKQIIVVGPRENLFHYLPQVRHFGDFDTALAWIS